MRTSVFAAILMFSGFACDGQEPAPEPARAAPEAPAPARAAAEAPAPPPARAATQAIDPQLLALPIPDVPEISNWDLDPENSSAGFVCNHVFSKVRGMFAQPTGTVFLDEVNPEKSKINATLDVNQLSTGVDERDTHLKGPDFFDAATYPVITFVSTAVTRSNASTYAVTGDLSIHGVTRPVTLAVDVSPPFNHAGGIRRGIEATTEVNRKDFDLRWEYPGEGPGIVVGDNISITINAELVFRPEADPGPE